MNQDSQSRSDLPDAIISDYQMTEPNEEVKLYEGTFKLQVNDKSYPLEGRIYFSWFPAIGVKFYGETDNNQQDILLPMLLDLDTSYKLVMEDAFFEDVYLTRTAQSNSKLEVEGGFSGRVILGDQSIPVSKVKFAVPNLRSFWSMIVKHSEGQTNRTDSARTILEDDNCLITIDKNLDFEDQYKKLQRQGGYIILYLGELEIKKGQIDPNELEEIALRLAYFLSFLNGRMTTPLFFQGIHNKKEKWADFTRRFHIDQPKNVTTWPPKNTKIEGLNETWQKFNNIFDEENDKDFLTSAMWWYIEANSGNILLESQIVIAQNCLELLYNWLVVEKKKIIIGDDSKNISAANKIRLLIAQIHVNTQVPPALSFLSTFVKSSNNVVDGADALAQIRNKIVHSRQKNRENLSKIDEQTKIEVLELALWYIELSLLYILNFNGKYYNRCSKATSLVPWYHN